MTLALYGKSRRRQGGLLSLGLLAVLIAMIAGVATITSAFAHHNTITKSRECNDSWAGSADYVGGNDRRLLVIEDVVVNGQAYATSWSTDPGDPSPFGGDSISAYSLSASDFWDNAPTGTSIFMWDDTDNGFSIYDRSGGAGTFDSNWGGRISLYERDGRWSSGQFRYKWTRVDVDTVTAPVAPTGCTPPPPEKCSDFGLSMVDKLQWNGSSYVLDDTGSFPGQQVTITNGTATGGDWNSTVPIGLVIVKAGNGPISVKTYPSPAPPFFPAGTTSGSFDNTGLLNNGGQVPAVSHVEFCEGTAVLNTGKIIVKKIGPTIPSSLATTIDFGGAVTGPDTGSWTAKVGGVDASNDGIANGQYTVTETSGTGSVTGGKIELVGYEELAGDATCPTPDANNYNDDGVVTVAEDTHTVCVLNKFIADPTLTKVKGSGGATPGGLAYWDVKVDNTANTADSVDVFIKDSGATLASVVSGGSCTGTDLGAGVPCTVNAGAVLILSVTKPAPSAQCLPGSVNNFVRMWLGDEAGDKDPDAEAGGTPDTKYDISGDPTLCGQPSITKKLVTGGTEPVTVTDPNNIAWTVVVTNPATLPGANQTVVIKDQDVVVSSGPSFTGGADCDPNSATAAFEAALTSASGVSCDMPGGEQLQSTITFTVKPVGEIARTCEDQTFNNTASIEVGGGDPINAIGPTITLDGDADLCPKPKVKFVKLMCGPDVVLPGNETLLFTSPNPVTYPGGVPADCFPMEGWNFYTGTTWNGSTLGGTLATHMTGADGTVTHEMTTAEFNAAKTASGSPYTSYLVREETRSPYTFGALQCYMDFGGAKADNIEQVNFKDNPVADATCIAYNFIPRVTVNFIKAICPSLSDVPSNQAQGGGDADRGGLLGAAAPAADVKVDLDNIPEDCTTVPGWQFNTGTSWEPLGGSTDSHLTVVDGISSGIAGVKHTLTGAEFMASLAGYEATGKSYFVQEVEQSPDYLFGAIKCYGDHYLDDRIERVDFAQWGLPGVEEEIYCIAYNVKAEREIEIEKHFVNTGGYNAGEGDVPEFTLNDPDYPLVTFDSACEPLTNGAPNHLAWTCTVPYDWDGTVTETPAEGWEEVKCEEPESFISQVSGLVQSILEFDLQRYWEFCNAPYGTVIVNKLNTSASGPNFIATISGLPATDIFGGSLDSSPTIAQGSPSNQTLVPLGPGAYSVTEVNAGTTETCGSGATNYFTIVQAPADTVLDTPGEIQTWTIVNQPCGVLGQGGLVLEKYRDNNGDGTANGSDAYEPWTIKVTGPGGYDQTFVLTAAQMPFLVGPLAPGNYTVSELTASGWVAIGLRVDNGALVAAATQTTVAVDGGANVLRGVTFYNQPRVNIEVNKTEISLATPAGAPGSGWSFTLTGCGITPQVKATDATGKATFSNLPPAVGCSYTVTETVKGGWSAINPVQVTAPSTAGQTSVLGFTNVKIEVCTICITIVTPTPTTTPTTPATTPTPETPTPETPAATPETPTAEPTGTEDTAGERTPGPQTPIAPSTGTGLKGGSSGMSMLFALVGLVAISLGTTILALGRKASRR